MTYGPKGTELQHFEATSNLLNLKFIQKIHRIAIFLSEVIDILQNWKIQK